MKKPRILVLLFLVLATTLYSQEPIADSTKQNAYTPDDPVASMLDSLADLTIFKDNIYISKSKNSTSYYNESIPYFSDSVYRARIADMNEQSPFEYVYNDQVRMFIDLYSVRKRALTARIIGLSQVYFPLFEEQLDKYNMPLELKYLAVIESALNPIANSRAGAKGLWQFMYGTGKVYGLKVTSYVDDRYDPYKSTVAACEHLKDLYNIYGNWSLALAAYNSGAGNVNKAIRRSGGLKNFWAIYPYLPKETRSYVPAFIAASYVLTYSDQHNIKPVDPGILYYEIDTVTVKSVLTFDQISEMLHIPMDELVFLNPWFKQKVIPATPENPYSLRLRKDYVGEFINNENALYGYRTTKALEKDSLKSLVENSYRPTLVYTVRSGDNVASIAKKYHMTTSELKALNTLHSNYVKPRQKLLVYAPGTHIVTSPGTPEHEATTTTQVINPPRDSSTETNTSPPPVSPKYHTVKSGETLNLIAGKYGCTVNQIIAWNNLSGSKIMVGQKLKVYGSSTTASAAKHVPSTAGTTKPSSGSKWVYYTIQSGDNLWDIAQKYDVTVAQIKNLNNLTNTSRLRPGQKIKIPSSK
jgi:membrane-bound lytic murein transglycosylase D